MPERYLVLFDMDETLIQCKSLFEAYKAYCLHDISDATIALKKYNFVMDELRKLKASGSSRSEINQAFYANFSGISRTRMRHVIHDWFANQCHRKCFFRTAVLDELERHQSFNAHIVVVSGSFSECIDPIIKYLAIEHSVSTVLEVEEDHYTGRIIGDPVIGKNKVLAVNRYLQQQGLPSKCRYAYSDHVSDLPLLDMADTPVVIMNNDSALMAHAIGQQWRVID